MKKTYSGFNVDAISGTATLITMLIIVTPLCGLIFQCGCDWPWSGLDAGCNFYKPDADHRCPWCASKITGLFSTGLAIISGVLTAMTPLPLAITRPANEVAARILLGLTVFALVAVLTAGLAALSENYSLGVEAQPSHKKFLDIRHNANFTLLSMNEKCPQFQPVIRVIAL